MNAFFVVGPVQSPGLLIYRDADGHVDVRIDNDTPFTAVETRSLDRRFCNVCVSPVNIAEIEYK